MSGSAPNQTNASMPVSYVATPHEPTTRELAIEAARGACYSGAAIRRNHLVIATVQGSASTGFRLCLEQSAQIELEDRDQQSLRFFHENLQKFIVEAGISRILLKSLPTTGRFHTGLGYKVEAAAQLLAEVDVELIHFNTIEKWKRYSREIAPEPIHGLSHWEGEAHRAAIATACYAEMHAASVPVAQETKQ